MADRRKDLGRRIAAARGDKGWKQKDLAAAVHVENVTVSRWETGRHTPSIEMLERIGEATGRELSYFLETQEGDAIERSAADAEALALLIQEIRDLRAGQAEHARRQEEARSLLDEIATRLGRIEARQVPKRPGQAAG